MDVETEGLKDFKKKAIRANNFLHNYILKFETFEWSREYKKSVAKVVVTECKRLVRELSDEIDYEYLEIPTAVAIKDSLQIELNLLEKVALPYVN